jgi:hypothetical protein
VRPPRIQFCFHRCANPSRGRFTGSISGQSGGSGSRPVATSWLRSPRTKVFYGWRMASLDFDFYVVPNHSYVVSLEVFICRRTEDFSRAHIEPGAMPRAGHLVPLDFSLG